MMITNTHQSQKLVNGLMIGCLYYSCKSFDRISSKFKLLVDICGILTFCLITQIITGLTLAMHYIAHADMVFDSVEHIMRDVNYGWLIRYIHANGASMFFLAVYIHIFRSLFYGSYKAPREIIWIIESLFIY